MLLGRQQAGYATQEQLEAITAFAGRELQMDSGELQGITRALFGAARLRELMESEAKALMFLLRERSGFVED